MAKRKRSAKSSDAGKTCPVCPSWFAWVVLLVGLLYLLRDLNLGDWTAGVQWYSAAFTLLGLKWVSLQQS